MEYSLPYASPGALFYILSLGGKGYPPPPPRLQEKKVGVADFGLFLGLLLGSRLICMVIFRGEELTRRADIIAGV